MRERLAELGFQPEYGRELLGFDQDAAGVTARVAGPDKVETIRCRYLVAADGGRSYIRQALQLDFPSDTALRNMIKRYTGLRASEIRARGGMRAILDAFGAAVRAHRGMAEAAS